MAFSNLKMLTEKPFMVSWKADGVRYLMLLNGKDQVYMVDRDNTVFKVLIGLPGINVFHKKCF